MAGQLKIGQKTVGAEQPAYIVAEVGINHNGDMELAKKTIKAAKDSGADAVKFQNYKTEDFVPTRSETHTYLSQGKTITESQYDMFKRYELTNEQIIEIVRFCNDITIDFHSTPTNAEGVRLLQDLGVEVLKNGSDYLLNLPLIETMTRTGLPLVLSTGMADEEDIDEAVSTFENSGGKELLILHCVSQYPTPFDQLNLKRISTLQNKYTYPVGFSDHSNGTQGSCLAVAIGACWIEKHFTLDKSLPGPDHSFSCDPTELKNLVNDIRAVESALGTGQISTYTENELESRDSFRLSCAAARNLPAGTVLGDGDIAFFRPGIGIPPKNKVLLIGRLLKHEVTRGEILTEEMLK